MTRNEWVNVTDCPHSARFLIYILENGNVKKSDFQKYVNSSTVTAVLDFLKSLELIRIQEISKPRKMSIVHLTEDGKKTAMMFKRMIQGDLDDVRQTNLSAPSEEGDTVRE